MAINVLIEILYKSKEWEGMDIFLLLMNNLNFSNSSDYLKAPEHEYIFLEIFSDFKYFGNILSMLHEE